MTQNISLTISQLTEAVERIKQALAVFLKYSLDLPLLTEISYEEKMQRRIISLEQEVIRLGTMNEQTELASALSGLMHDILNHVNVIKGYTEMVKESVTEPVAEEALLPLDHILLQTTIIMDLVESLKST